MPTTELRIAQWFPFGNHELVRTAAPLLRELGVTDLRTFFSWADWAREDGVTWFDFVVATLTSQVPDLTILPCLSYTPPSLARPDEAGKQLTSYPPKNLQTYTDFVGEVLHHYHDQFPWIQLWNEPNWDPYWSWNMDPTGELFAQMVLPAAKNIHAAGCKVALGGTTPLDYAWFGKMESLDLLAEMDAVGFHYSPSWQNQHRRWQDLQTEIDTFRALLNGLEHNPEIWLMETGFSTWKQDNDRDTLTAEQIDYFSYIEGLSIDRWYWYSLIDQSEQTPTDDELNSDADRDRTAYYFGMVKTDGTKKALFDHLKHIKNPQMT